MEHPVNVVRKEMVFKIGHIIWCYQFLGFTSFSFSVCGPSGHHGDIIFRVFGPSGYHGDIIFSVFGPSGHHGDVSFRVCGPSEQRGGISF